MSLQLDSEVFLRELGTKEQEKIGEMVQAALQNNMVKIHMALGGMFACQELQRHFKAHVDGIARRAEEHEQQRPAARLAATAPGACAAVAGGNRTGAGSMNEMPVLNLSWNELDLLINVCNAAALSSKDIKQLRDYIALADKFELLFAGTQGAQVVAIQRGRNILADKPSA